MTSEATGASERHEDQEAVGSPVERPVRPIAWCSRPNGGSFVSDEARDNVPIYREVYNVPLYDQSALDAAVAAERERWQRQCAGKRHAGCHYVATCGSVCSKCGQVA